MKMRSPSFSFVASILIAFQETIKDVIAHIMLNYEDSSFESREARRKRHGSTISPTS